MHKKLWTVLGSDRLPWRDELARIVDHFNRKHAVKAKDVAHKTREDRKEFYFAFFTELRDNPDAPMGCGRTVSATGTSRSWFAAGSPADSSPARSSSTSRTCAPLPSGSAIPGWC